MDINIVALIASVFSIGLAIVAIWQANHHRDQSDKLNRDTTEKLVRIEESARSTKEDAFKELEKGGDFARAGGKATEEELRKLREDLRATTSQQINKVLQSVDSAMLSSSIGTSAISEIKKEFEELNKEMGKIQDKALAGAEDAAKKNRITTSLALLSARQKDILRRIAENPNWTTPEDLKDHGYARFEMELTFNRPDLRGLVHERLEAIGSGGHIITGFKLDEDLKKALLE